MRGRGRSGSSSDDIIAGKRFRRYVSLRRSLIVAFIATLLLGVLEGTTGIDRTEPNLPTKGRLLGGAARLAPLDDLGAYAVEGLAAQGWVPRGIPAEVISMWQGRLADLPDIGVCFGPDFFTDSGPQVGLVVVRGMFNYRQGSLVEYRPTPPALAQVTLLFDLESGGNFYWGYEPIGTPPRHGIGVAVRCPTAH